MCLVSLSSTIGEKSRHPRACTRSMRTGQHNAGRETFPRGSAPHRHLEGYASVVLAGSFVEAGFWGRVNVEPGDVLLHGRFDCHANSTNCSRSVQILRLPWL